MGYNILRSDRNRHGGGILCNIKKYNMAGKKIGYVCAVPPGQKNFCSPGRVKIPLFHFFVTLIFLFLFSTLFIVQ